MLDIALDGIFIIIGTYARTDSQGDFEDRTEQVMKDVGISITASTLTTFFAFLLGGMASLPAIRWFAWYAAPTVMFDFTIRSHFSWIS